MQYDSSKTLTRTASTAGASTVSRDGDVHSELGQLRRLLDATEQRIVSLQMRLEPVLLILPPAKSEDDGKAPQPTRSRIGQELFDANERVSRILSALEALDNSIQV